MFSRIVSSFRSKRAEQRKSAEPIRRAPLMENLEGRTLMSIVVDSIVADNRGKVLVTLNPNGGTVDPATITKTSCILYSAGTDKIFGTIDDVRERENVVWTPAFNRITISSKQKAGTGYRIRLSATRIRTLTGDVMDGEFKATGPSGDGAAGGDFNIQTKNDKSSAPTVRMNTTFGTIVLRMNLTAAPKTAAYFLGRANASFYDGLMVTKNIAGTDAGIGAGSLKITQANEYEVTSIGSGKAPETTGLTNTRGTISMDRIPVDTTKEGNGFFINSANNTASNRTVFGTVRSGLAALDAINNLTTLDLAPQHFFTLVDTKKVPIVSAATSETFSPNQHAVIISRTAVQMKVSSI